MRSPHGTVSTTTTISCLLFIAVLPVSIEAVQSTFNYVPIGQNPTLYTPGFEPIMHLDQVFF